MDKDTWPQFMRLALNIAYRIAEGEFHEGEKLQGRSTLSSHYRVSPETVRKALSLLADMGIVSTKEGSGTTVISVQKAKEYLGTIRVQQEQRELFSQLQTLFKEYTATGQRLVEVGNRLIAASSVPLPSEQALPNYEIEVPDNSDKIGMSIGDLRFWQCTGATIVAIRRGQNVIISPGPYVELQAKDIIVYVGPLECKKAVEQLLGGGQTDNTLYNIQQQIIMAVHAKELFVVAKCLNAKLGDITGITSMTKGMTNISYMFTCKGEQYTLRIPGEGTSSVINRQNEADVYHAISGYGLCDDPIYLNPQNGLKVTKFLNHVRNCDPFSESDIRQSMDLLRKFHSLHLKVNHRFDLFGNINVYERSWDGQPSVYDDYDQTKKNIFSLKPYIDNHKGEEFLTHIDAVPDNFLFYEHEGKIDLQLTDWEYAGMQDPHVDIAMFSIYSGYDKAHIDHLINLYFQNGCDPETRIKIYCYVAVAGLLWSNWAEYKGTLGIDYTEYGKIQYQYAKRFYIIAKEEIERL